MVIGAGTVILSYLPACAIGRGFVGEITVRQVSRVVVLTSGGPRGEKRAEITTGGESRVSTALTFQIKMALRRSKDGLGLPSL